MKKVSLLWWITFASCLMLIILFPSQRNLNRSRDELASVEHELRVKQAVVKHNFPISNNFDLFKAKEVAQKRLIDAFSVVYGGLHSKGELDKNLVMIQKNLGKKLAEQALLDSYNQSDFFLTRNVQTRVGIKTVTNKRNCEILVIVIYQMKNSSNTYSKVYNLNYDLEKQRVLSYTYSSMSV